MQPHTMRELAVHMRDVSDVEEELAEFEGVAAEMFEASFAGKELLVVIAYHGNATARWGHHVVVVLEYLEETPSQNGGVLCASDIRHRLPTTGLFLWELNLEAETPQNAESRNPHFRIELIHITWYEQAKLGHMDPQY
jgi:hypothetical protein